MMDFDQGLTVKELKEIIADWPDEDELGELSEVWIGYDGVSSQCFSVVRLNRSDILLEFD